MSSSWDEFFADLEKRKEQGLDVVQYPHPALFTEAVEVKTFRPEIKKVVDLMFQIMYSRKGVGLAAPQIGLPLQIIIVNSSAELKDNDNVEYNLNKELVFINPSIQPKQKGKQPPKMSVEGEGCLSIPGLYRNVTRPHGVTFQACHIDGTAWKGEYNGTTARVIQHEYDHLRGRLFVDRLEGIEAVDLPQYLEYLKTQFEILQSYQKLPSYEDMKIEIEKLKELA